MIDGVTVRRNGNPLPGGDCSLRPVLRAGFLGAVEDRNTGPARNGKEPFGWSDRAMGEQAAGIGIARIELVGRMRSTAIHQVVEIDGEQRRPPADESLAPPAGIEFQIGLGDHVFRHGRLRRH